MKTKIHYKCQTCGNTQIKYKEIGKSDDAAYVCNSCGGIAVREYLAPTHIDIQDDSVSWATQHMLHSGMPSGKDKALI
jgi:uncharacterized Zn finger protein